MKLERKNKKGGFNGLQTLIKKWLIERNSCIRCLIDRRAGG
jgi:hypothetical protein